MQTAETTLTELAPAKINLVLQVLGKRPDGYHDIRSVLVPISIFDRVRMTRKPEHITFSHDPASPVPDTALHLADPADNLIVKVAKALKQSVGVTDGVHLDLYKATPVGAGMGGGSSDAAATLLGLNRLWNLNLTLDRLQTIGATLGCDIPALMERRAVSVEGLGERVTPLEGLGGRVDPRWSVVVVNPGFPVMTGDIYRRHRLTLTDNGERYKGMVCSLREGDVHRAAANLCNDLQDTVFRKYPLIEMMVECLRDAGALGAMVSGSGASVFGLARDPEDARLLAGRFRERIAVPVWVQVAQILPDGVMAAHGPLEA